MNNRLHEETSPYLLQHANNPVHWQPWDDAALAAARNGGKPILLSIGYSACHWCHVMAHESFEDAATASVMNEHFVCIKVDREERPDLDKVYQQAHQVLTRNTGGWPLTLFLEPETLTPFFGGTYFPRTPRHGLPGFTDLLLRIASVYREKRDELLTQGEKVREVLVQLQGETTAATMADEALLSAAREALGKTYDHEFGGFGDAPKFPMPMTVERVLRHWAFAQYRGSRDRDGLDMVMHTLTQMARGGIFDHLGGGFCRYATDRRWRIPHFEKMLYDNAQLIHLYASALRVGPDALLAGTLEETVHWLLREMHDDEGGFHTALDADADGTEGSFYVWRREQVRRLLTDDEYLLIETLYGLDKPANFENKWILYRTDSWRSVVHRLSMDSDHAAGLLASARRKLFVARSERVPPGRDDKVLTGWNGLAIKGLAAAATSADRVEWLEAAHRAADFLRNNVWKSGRLLATWKHGTGRHGGCLDDYAFVIDGLLALLRRDWRDEHATFLLDLVTVVLDQFEDTTDGGFYFTPHDHEAPLVRLKSTVDDAVPPGNAVLAQALTELGHLFAEPRYLDTAARTLAFARQTMEQLPAGHCAMLSALEDQTYPPQTIILRGPKAAAEDWRRTIDTGYRPWRHIYVIPYEGVHTAPAYLPRLVSAATREKVTAFVCHGLQCGSPLTSLEELQAQLE
ncbi:MAG: thioredoxin domain-containing protein [Pseudomonadales bacterium]|nr:thioredoxin domain-containing protein [Pseudomonadales bacterium]MCP5183383.1 thioredoxin domain-containing protein [Pseudomonadales bacterium]